MKKLLSLILVLTLCLPFVACKAPSPEGEQDAVATTDNQYHLLTGDEMGALRTDFTDAYFAGTNYHFLKKGVRQITEGLYAGDSGYYYYALGSGTLKTNGNQYISAARTNALVTAGSYAFDAQGRLTKPLLTVEDQQNIGYTVIGRVVTVSNIEKVVTIGYLKNGVYTPLKATENADGSYNFAAPASVNKVIIVVKGDADCDGSVDADDINVIKETVLSGNLTLDSVADLAADANGDGRVTAADIARINAVLLEKTDIDW